MRTQLHEPRHYTSPTTGPRISPSYPKAMQFSDEEGTPGTNLEEGDEAQLRLEGSLH